MVQANVPSIVLLRVGPSNTAAGAAVVSSLDWNVTLAIPTGVVPTTGSNQATPWNGAAPVASLTNNPPVVSVWAYTNAGTASVSCSLQPNWTGPGGGPTNANFTVTATGTLPHPGGNLGACGTSVNITRNSVLSGTWQYALGGNPSTWRAGTHGNSITYTASAI
jgi:hypothetical protein